MARIPERAEALLEAQGILFVLYRFVGNERERGIVVARAKEEMAKYGKFNLLLELGTIGLEDVNFYRDEALEALERRGFEQGKAHELMLQYRSMMAERLGVTLNKDGGQLSNRFEGRGVASAM